MKAWYGEPEVEIKIRNGAMSSYGLDAGSGVHQVLGEMLVDVTGSWAHH